MSAGRRYGSGLPQKFGRSTVQESSQIGRASHCQYVRGDHCWAYAEPPIKRVKASAALVSKVVRMHLSRRSRERADKSYFTPSLFPVHATICRHD